MQRLIREAMFDGALGFSTAPNDRGDPAGVPDDAERWALASVLGELGTGVFQVAGGAPGGTKQTRAVARELAARTGRPSIYNLMSDPIGNPDEWVEHLKWLEDGFKSGARCYGSCLSTVAGAIFNLERGLNVPQDEDITASRGLLPRHADLGPGHGPALSGAHARVPRPGDPQGDVRRGGRRHGRAARRDDRPARPHPRPLQPALGPRRSVHDDEGAEPPSRGQEHRADRQGAEQGHHGRLPRPVAR